MSYILSMNVYGYVRVSTRSQNYDEQVDQIKKFCQFKDYTLVNIFTDKTSGKDTDRKGFQEMLSALEENPLRIGVIISTKLDRIGRSLLDLINFSVWCRDKKIDLIFTQSSINTTTSEGRLFFHNMGAFAEFERERIAERTSEGRTRFVNAGGKLGRNAKPVNVDEAKRLIAMGVPKAEVARKLKIDRSTLYKRLGDSQ
jgi:DNA invertase Pin-like site-specific DNA recombinase